MLFVSGDGKRNAKKDLDALEMLKIAKKMRMKGSVPDHVKFAVVANPNTERRFRRVFGAESRRRGGVGNHATVF